MKISLKVILDDNNQDNFPNGLNLEIIKYDDESTLSIELTDDEDSEIVDTLYFDMQFFIETFGSILKLLKKFEETTK